MVGESKLHYVVEGDGKVLVFIHGLSDDLNYWEVLTANLKKNFKVIRFDLQGHGESELVDDEISIDIYANDLKNLLDGLNVKKVNLVGFSLGGAIALDFSIKYSDYVDSLVLMSSFSKSDDYSKNIFNQFKNALKSSFEDFYDLILPMVLCKNVIENHNEELKMLKQIASQNADTEAYIKAVDACCEFDVDEDLAKINIPTLILAGKYDEIFLPEMQADFKNKIKNSRLIVFDDVKHNLLVGKNNIKVVEILNEFLK